MSDEKSPSTEESPETHPEVTGEVTTEEASAAEMDEETSEPADAGEESSRPEATGGVSVEDVDEEAPEAGEDGGAESPAAAEGTAREETEPRESDGVEDEDSASPEESVGDVSEETGVALEREGADEVSPPPTEEQAPAPEVKKKRKKRKRKRKKGPRAGESGEGGQEPKEEPPEIAALRQAKEEGTPVQGRVFGWNKGGFHVVVGAVPAFCPRSEMEVDGRAAEPESYIDQTLEFLVIRVQGKGRRVVLSRAALERREQHRQRQETLKALSPGTVTRGTVSSVVDFGAFVELGGVEGLVHRSEITRARYDRIEEVVQVGREVEVKVLKIEKGGRRISLSMKALEADPWRDVQKRFPEGAVVNAKVDHTAGPGAFIELEPGLTGLLPTSEMNIPREAIPARIFPPGKEVKVVVMSVDPRRRRISLALEGSKVGATHRDLAEFQKQQRKEESGFGALASAFEKLGGGKGEE